MKLSADEANFCFVVNVPQQYPSIHFNHQALNLRVAEIVFAAVWPLVSLVLTPLALSSDGPLGVDDSFCNTHIACHF